jgi:hypothetical protein
VTAIVDASNASRSILRPSFISVYFILTLYEHYKMYSAS